MQRFQYLMVGLGLLLMVGIQGCVIPPPKITCDTMEYTVLPGETKDVLNPCEFTPGISSGGHWEPEDNFFLGVNPFPETIGSITYFPLPRGVQLDRIVDKKTGKVTRKLVADPSGVELVENHRVLYVYYNGTFHSPDGAFLTVSTLEPIQVSLSANPPTITAGQPSELRAMATGGIPPYRYSWKQPGDSNFFCIAEPCANTTLSVRPATTSTYSVEVRDNAGVLAHASVIVNVSGSSAFRLTVVDNSGIPNLFVSSPPPDRIIRCFNGANCSGLFLAGTNVTLTAEVNKVSWTGCDAFSNSTCTVLMNADRIVTVLPP